MCARQLYKAYSVCVCVCDATFGDGAAAPHLFCVRVGLCVCAATLGCICYFKQNYVFVISKTMGVIVFPLNYTLK
jgi:hypothetical protein